MVNSDAEKEILARYQRRMENELNPEKSKEEPSMDVYEGINQTATQDYKDFLKESLPEAYSIYENLCDQAEKLLKIKLDPAKHKELKHAIDVAHLNVTPSGVKSLSYLLPTLVVIFFGMMSYILLSSMFLFMFFVVLATLLINPLGRIPFMMADKWKMRASNQMILSIFYVVTYMRHTSNLEKAIEFASDQLGPPLGLDFKKIVWNVETQKYSSLKESLDIYLETWRKTNDEFIESMHLIESSLYEGYEDRRLDLLDKSLDVILDGTFEHMLHFAQSLKGPINTLNMLGVILPILGLVMLPLVVSFLDGIRWYHISALYNIALPLAVYMYGEQVLTNRPAGYGAIEFISKTKKKNYKILGLNILISPLLIALLIGGTFILIGLSPIIVHLIYPDFDIAIYGDEDNVFDLERMEVGFTHNENASINLIDYQPFEEKIEENPDANQDAKLGPFGLLATLLSLFIPLGLGFGASTYFRLKSEDAVEVRAQSKKLENEFSSGLFQLSNRLGDGIPAEIAFSRVAEVMKDTEAGKFFTSVSNNIQNRGVGIKEGILDPHYGAINKYPSALVKTAMKVLVQSVKKGPLVAAQAMGNVARYLKEIHKVDERLRDLMSEIISSMRSQVSFLAPAIAGVVVGIAAMISTVMGKLGTKMNEMESENMALDMFGQGIPTYHIQVIVGLYIVQLAFILTVLSQKIEKGDDPIGTDDSLGRYMKASARLYVIISAIVITLFNLIAIGIVNSTAT